MWDRIDRKYFRWMVQNVPDLQCANNKRFNEWKNCLLEALTHENKFRQIAKNTWTLRY